MARSYKIETAAGRVAAAKKRHAVMMDKVQDESLDLSAQDFVKLCMEARQTEIHMRNEQGFVSPVDKAWIDQQVKRAEEAAEKIHGGRPRRVQAPGPASDAGTRH